KANMNELAAGVAGANKNYGNAHNPWDVARWPGGSSSGSGAAVAAGVCLGGIGSDTGISVRGPAGWCGIVGVRPTYGRVSVAGVYPRAYSFDTIGPLARTVADAATLLNAMVGYDPTDKYSIRSPREDFTAGLDRGVRGVRLGIVENFTYRNVDAEVADAVRGAADKLASVGAEGSERVGQFTVPVSFTGFPAVSVPCGFGPSGLPIGLHIVGNDMQEALLLRIAATLEAATKFHERKPPLYCA